MLISCLFIPLLSHLITNQVSIWSLRSSQAHPHRCSYSDSGNSATASIVGPAPLDPSQDRGGHQQEEWSRHPDRWSLGPYPPHLTARTLCSYKCVCVSLLVPSHLWTRVSQGATPICCWIHVWQLERQTLIRQLHQWIPLIFLLVLLYSGFSHLRLL
jgi:hypothetical protein